MGMLNNDWMGGTPNWAGDGGLTQRMQKPVFSQAGIDLKKMWLDAYNESIAKMRALDSGQLAEMGRQLAHAQRVGDASLDGNYRLHAAIAAYTTVMDERRPAAR